MLAVPYPTRWVVLAVSLIGVIWLVSHGRQSLEPLVGSLADTPLPFRAVKDGSLATLDESDFASLPAQPITGASGQIAGYQGPFISTQPRDARLERSKIVKLSMLYYDDASADTEAYERAMLSHIPHDEKFGYDHFVLRRALMEGFWTKIALNIQFLLQELAKPAEDRYEWIFWHDADLVLVNHNVPLELFLPPVGRQDVHFLIANDLSGFNSGVYFLRVNEWAVQFMASSLSYPIYNPSRNLMYSDQSAQDLMLRQERWHKHTVHVPQRWFNAYHHFGRNMDIPPEWEWTNGYVEPGDLLVHLPGTGGARSLILDEWLEKKGAQPEIYCPPLDQTRYEANITAFWENDAPNERETQQAFWRRYKLIQATGWDQDRLRDAAVEEAERATDGWSEEARIQEIDRVKEEWRLKKIAALREAEDKALLAGTVYLNDP